MTRELGHQSEIELQIKLQNEVEAERVTRLDKTLLSEQQEQGVIDLRPGEGATFLVRENRNLMIGRVRHLERYGMANEFEPGRWSLSDRAEQVLKELDHRNEAINSMMGERVYLVVDGIDGRVHHIEFKDPSRIEEVRRDMIVEAAPVVSGPRPADHNIAAMPGRTTASTGQAGTWSVSVTVLSVRARTPKLSCVSMSDAFDMEPVTRKRADRTVSAALR